MTADQNIIIPNISLTGTASTTCTSDGSGYFLTLKVRGEAPYTGTGTGAPGTWSGDTWTSGAIAAGTNYNKIIEDAYACNTLVVSDTAPACCLFDVVCPTFPTTTIICYGQLPTATTLNEAEFEALGNNNGIIGNIPCGVIEITAFNEADPHCNGQVLRTYTVIEYSDPNNNKIRDPEENTFLNSTNCTQVIAIETDDFIMPANDGTTVACASSIVPPNLPPVIDNCGNVLTPTPAVITAGPACNGSVTYTYTYTFTDCHGNAHDWVYTYTLNNMAAPTGTAPVDLSLQCIADIPSANANAVTNIISNCNGKVIVTVADINNEETGSPENPFIIKRTYTLTDCSGLTTNIVQTIKVIDDFPPVFVEVLPKNKTLDCSTTIPAAVTLTAIDNCSNTAVTYSETRVDDTCAIIIS